jgi:hypothetical protein
MAFVFLSYNHADKEDARAIAAHLKLTGAEVWIDEWEVRAGDSIPGKLNEGLSAFDIFVLVWSESAARSNWVRDELQSAIKRGIDDETIRIIPVLIDRTPLPPLLSHLRYLRVDESVAKVVDEILGFANERSRTMAIQQTLDEAGIDVGDFPGYGPIVGCPSCGAGLKSIAGWSQTDYERDDVYAGARCTECGWSGGGEI